MCGLLPSHMRVLYQTNKSGKVALKLWCVQYVAEVEFVSNRFQAFFLLQLCCVCMRAWVHCYKMAPHAHNSSPFFYRFCINSLYMFMSLSDTNNCPDNVCKNFGICVNGVGNYSCQCPAGTTGQHCETGTCRTEA